MTFETPDWTEHDKRIYRKAKKDLKDGKVKMVEMK